jgi:hypothetical protein
MLKNHYPQNVCQSRGEYRASQARGIAQAQAGNVNTQQAQNAAAHLISLETSLTAELTLHLLKSLKKILRARLTHCTLNTNVSTFTDRFLPHTPVQIYCIYIYQFSRINILSPDAYNVYRPNGPTKIDPYASFKNAPSSSLLPNGYVFGSGLKRAEDQKNHHSFCACVRIRIIFLPFFLHYSRHFLFCPLTTVTLQALSQN